MIYLAGHSYHLIGLHVRAKHNREPCQMLNRVHAASASEIMSAAGRPWATLHASTDAAGHVLLAHRGPWRQSLATNSD